MTAKPFCSKGDFLQAKKWIWKLDRLAEGGYWLCSNHFDAALAAEKISFDGRFYAETE